MLSPSIDEPGDSLIITPKLQTHTQSSLKPGQDITITHLTDTLTLSSQTQTLSPFHSHKQVHNGQRTLFLQKGSPEEPQKGLQKGAQTGVKEGLEKGLA